MKKLLFVFVTLFLSSAASFAASYTWNGGSGDWSVAGNWTPGSGPPGAGDTATINGGTATVSDNRSVGQLDLNAGALTGAGTLTVNSVMNWIGGTMMDGGVTYIEANATLNINSPTERQIAQRRLDNAGTIYWSNTGNLSVDDGAVVTNRPGATFEAQNNRQLLYSTGQPSRFDNVGTYRKAVVSGNGTNTLSLTFNNYGAIDLQSGTLHCLSPLNNYGTVSLAAGTTNRLSNSGTVTGTFDAPATALVEFGNVDHVYNLNPGAQLNGAGLYRLDGMQLYFNTHVTVANFDFRGGGLRGGWTLSISNEMNWTGGYMTDGGVTYIGTNATLNINSTSDRQIAQRRLDNAGTIYWSNTGNFSVDDSAVVTNRPGATFEAQNNRQLLYSTGQPSRFDNAGTFRKTASTGTTILSLPFNNYGTLDLRSGIVLLTGSYSPSAGARLHVTIGGLTPGTQFSQLQVTGIASLDGHLNIALANGFVPGASDEFLVLTCASRLGTFATADSQPLGPRTFLNPVYLANGVKLVVADAAGNFTSVQYNRNTHQARLSLAGIAGQSYVIEASTDLADWIPILTISVPGSTVLEFVDPDSPIYSYRFYRALFEP